MKLSTEKISLADGMSDRCNDCKAHRAVVVIQGGNVQKVDVYCNLTDFVVQGDIKEVRAEARRILGYALEPNGQYDCEPLNNASDLLAHPPRRAKIRRSSGLSHYRPDQRSGGVWETNDGVAASRWVASQAGKPKK